MSKFEATVAMMQKRVAESLAAVKRKRSVKSPPAPGSDAPILEEDRHRLRGKQAKPSPKPKVQTPISNFFKVASRALFLPIVTVLVRPMDCTAVDDGFTLDAKPSVRCWEGEHWCRDSYTSQGENHQ